MIKTEKVHIKEIKISDVVICEDGRNRTVCKKDLSYSQFMGISLFGYNYKCGHEKVERLIFKKWFKGKIIN